MPASASAATRRSTRENRADPLATHNERVKLFATFVNAIGIGLIGFAILGPVTQVPLIAIAVALAGIAVLATRTASSSGSRKPRTPLRNSPAPNWLTFPKIWLAGERIPILHNSLSVCARLRAQR